MQVEHVKPKVGSVVTMDRNDFLSGKYAKEIQDLLVARVITSYSIHYTKLYEIVRAN